MNIYILTANSITLLPSHYNEDTSTFVLASVNVINSKIGLRSIHVVGEAAVLVLRATPTKASPFLENLQCMKVERNYWQYYCYERPFIKQSHQFLFVWLLSLLVLHRSRLTAI